MKEVHIEENDANQRLDKFLFKAFPKMTKGMMYKAIRNKKIKLNRKRTSHDAILSKGDILLLFLPEDVLEDRQEKHYTRGDLDIVYEDNDLLVVNKPAGLLSQKDSSMDQDTLNDRIVGYLIDSGQYDPKKEASFTPAICHRLDRNTSGLVAAAKTARAARVMQEGLLHHDLQKKYLARVSGKMEGQGRFHIYLKKEGTKALISKTPKDGYADAITDYKVIGSDGKSSLLELDLKTGRFHQIRATLADAGHPLIGDHKYGFKGKEQGQKLCAYKLDISKLDLPCRQKVFEINPKEI